MIRYDGVSVLAKDSVGGTRPVLKDIDLSLDESRVGVIGANGSGKSTLIRLINGLVLPSSGSVSIKTSTKNLDTVDDAAAVRREVAFMFTNPQAGIVMPTPAEDVALSLKRTFKDRGERRHKTLDTLEKFGIADLADQSVHTLSGGQSQLLALAAVLATGPSILVADEPTTLLDLRNTVLIEEKLLSLEQQLIVATHNLDLAAKMDRVLVIADGEIAYDGVPEKAIAFYRESI